MSAERPVPLHEDDLVLEDEIVQRLGLTVNYDAIAAGLLQLMRQESEENELLIRFGMFPLKWIQSLEKLLYEKFRQQWQFPETVNNADWVFTWLEKPSLRCVAYFQLSKLVGEIVNRVCQKLYSSVDMVV